MQRRVLAQLGDILATGPRWQAWAIVGGLVVFAALAVGLYVAVLSPLYALALALAAAGGLLMLRSTQWGFFGLIAVVCLIPFGALPIDIGFRPTFLDLVLVVLFFVWISRIVTRTHGPLVLTPPGWPLLLFMLLAVAAFVAGLAHSRPTATILRHYVEILMALAIFYVVVNSVRTREHLRQIGWVLFGCGALQGFIAVVLYYLPSEWTVRLLSALGRFGYPTGSAVLRYIEDNPELPLRATGTCIGPNTLGGLLILVLGFAIPQVLARRPIVPRWMSVPAVAVMGLALYLTYSRTALVGLAAAAFVLGVLRYRRLLLVLILGGLLLLLLPDAQYYVLRLVEGFQFADRANQMRLGEYKDAFILISRHPWLGVGFAGTPEIDTYVSVASIYLLIAEQMGLVGLGAFLLTMGVLFLFLWGRRKAIEADPDLDGIFLGAAMGLVGALAGGLFDHYYFNMDFPSTVTFFWFFAGLTVACALVASQGRATAPSDGGAQGKATHVHVE